MKLLSRSKPQHDKKSKKTVQANDVKLHESAPAEKCPEPQKEKEFEKEESHTKEEQEENVVEMSLVSTALGDTVYLEII